MNLARKVEIAKTAIASITRHDDASEKELATAAEVMQKFLQEELKAAGARREARDARRVALLKGQ